ncbi:DNA-binding bromodomain-containing protein [Euphorbia peplus]|nr:DNA-binding bromodomain-containing protein [Euphorbia peplus]
MGQIVKRKKKGRPSKADLARRSAADTESDRRRSLRRRNVRYNNFIDYDDYLEELEDEYEIEEDEDEEERRKEKKLKLLRKLNNQEDSRNRTARGYNARKDAVTSEDDEEEEEEEKKPLKKRKINGGDDSEADYESENGNEDDNDNQDEDTERKADTKGLDSVPGTPSDHLVELPLPEKKSLELILDKLQKKDTYGVYAEPVDLEELPDYLDVVDHPMDFATVRSKLGNGSYATLNHFENDVYLICSNAMQYNSSDTVYHKQARTIKELAKKKFHKLRIDFERSDKEQKSEQKTKPNFLGKKQMKKPLNKTMQEPIGSDFSSGATLATASDIQNIFIASQASGYDRPSAIEGTAEGNSSLVDYNLDRAEELSSGKGLLSKFGRKSFVLEENRRTTYSISSQPVTTSESVFTTFESEIKQLVAVGLHAESSYARSMARFAATLGPVAWRVASQRIEQALPPGCKFGRGWVGEYEPLPTPVLMIEASEQKESVLFAKLQGPPDVVRGVFTSRGGVPSKDNHVRPPTSEGKSSLFRPTRGPVLEGRTSLFSSTGSKPSSPTPVNPPNQKPNFAPTNFGQAQNKASKQVELNFPPSNYQQDAHVVAEKKLPKNSEMAASKQKEMPRTVGLLESVSSKQPDNSSVGSGGVQNGKVSGSSNSRMIGLSSDGIPNQMPRGATFFVKGGQEHVLNDPVEAMRVSAQKHQKPHQSAGDDSSNAAATAARAWMSIGSAGFKPPTENSGSPKNQISAESLYNPTRQLHPQFPRMQGQFNLPPGMQFQTEKNGFPFQGFMRPPIHAGNDGHFQNRPMMFPQFASADLARLQMQSQWRGLTPHSQPKQKPEMLPPDLNIGFQSPGSPVKQSSSVMVDSQQPDLALQL